MKHRIRLFQILILLLLLVRIGESDVGSDREALINLRGDFGGRTLRWNITEMSPCLWLGVTCDSVGVTELRLPGAGLSGELPVGIGNLTRLRVLSLRFNALSGSVPQDLARLSGLAELHLQGNSFSGELPKFLLGMKSLVRLNLGSNDFSGEIPPELNNLTNLIALYLDENRFTGSIPEISLPGLDQFNVSHNSLNGSIPEKLSKFSVTSFTGNSLCGTPMSPCNGTETETGSKNHRRKLLSGGAIAAIVIACVLLLVILAAILIILGRRKHEKDSEKETGLKIQGSTKAETKAIERSDRSRRSGRGSGGKRNLVFLGKSVKEFDLEDLLRASAEVLGKGTFGTAYKAALETGVTLAVKRLKDATVSESEFRERMEQIGRLDHENLVPLRAYYFSRDEKLLVYDFMPIGSLSALLHGNSGAGRTPLNWETRSSIALGAARGITHLHSRGPFPSHGNITSSNILLTRSYRARVSDFGLAHLANPNPTPAHRLAGYRAPEVVADPTRAASSSPEADVYSFGVLLLELLTGKPPVHSRAHHDDGVEDLPRWVREVVREDEWTEEVFDVELLRYRNVEDEMVELLRLALHCTSLRADKRPPMAEVAARIEELCRLSSLKDESTAADDSSYAAD